MASYNCKLQIFVAIQQKRPEKPGKQPGKVAVSCKTQTNCIIVVVQSRLIPIRFIGILSQQLQPGVTLYPLQKLISCITKKIIIL